MKQRLCLHVLKLAQPEQLLTLAHKLLPEATVSYKLREKYFNDNDMYKYQLARFATPQLPGLRLQCAWGVLLANDKLQPIADIILEFSAERSETVTAVAGLLRRLLNSPYQFVLEEPDMAQRLDQLRGCFELRSLEAYDKGTAGSLLCCHLPWQLYGISKLWYELLRRGPERQLMRQQRVKLRRLRSLLTLCKPLLPTAEVTRWQATLKARAELLAAVREYDVALQTCTRLSHDRDEMATPLLTELLTRKRAEAARQVLQGQRLNSLTQELTELLLWLYVAAPRVERLTLKDFLQQRFDGWCTKLLELPGKYTDWQDMEQLHQVRIKLRRFRYALQSVPELAPEPKLLRSLKYLQDQLGLLHDAYVDRQLLEQLAEQHPEQQELRCELALYNGWEQGRAATALEQLPQQWESFCALLEEWRESCLGS